MIDGFVTMRLATDVEALERNPLLEWQDVSEQGELLMRYANAHGLRLRVKYPTGTRTRKVADLRGSLHQFHRAAIRREGRHNADAFTPAEVWEAVETLSNWYGIDPEKTALNGLEFGANVALPFAVETLLRRAICYRKNPFVQERGDVSVFRCDLDRYAVKLYDKGRQFRLAENVLRVEVTVSKMHYFSENGITLNTLADLHNPALYDRLRGRLLETFDGILFDETALDEKAMTAAERELLHRGRNARTWQPLRAAEFPTRTEYNRQRQQHRRALDRFRELLNTYRTGPDVAAEVAGLLASTLAGLSHSHHFSEGPKNGHLSHSHNLEDRLNCDNPPLPANSEINQLQNQPTTAETPKAAATAWADRMEEEPENGIKPECEPVAVGRRSVCLVTGVPLSGQRPGSKFIGETTLRKTPEVLDHLQTQHRTKRRRQSRTAEYYAAHNARNLDSNPANNLRRRVRRAMEQTPLFDPAGVIHLSDGERRLLARFDGTPWEITYPNTLRQ